MFSEKVNPSIVRLSIVGAYINIPLDQYFGPEVLFFTSTLDEDNSPSRLKNVIPDEYPSFST